MSILSNLDRNNLHHAYLIEGNREEIVPEILKFLEEIKFNIIGNPDFSHIALDSFKIDDAQNLKSFANEKANSTDKKIFIVSANSFLLEAQNSLLKLFEEPIENTHFFLIVPDTHALLRTFISRFYVVNTARQDLAVFEADKFIKMPLQKRIDFIKELLAEEDEEDDDGNEIIVLNSSRAKAGKFLNALEQSLHVKLLSRPKELIKVFEQIFEVRKFLRMPGSSSKTLLESLALIIPVL